MLPLFRPSVQELVARLVIDKSVLGWPGPSLAFTRATVSSRSLSDSLTPSSSHNQTSASKIVHELERVGMVWAQLGFCESKVFLEEFQCLISAAESKVNVCQSVRDSE